MDRSARPAGLIRFYRRPADPGIAAASVWPEGCRLESWRPAHDGPPPRAPHRGENAAWFAFEQLGLFASPGFEELTVWRDGRLLHRLIVTPRWLRFPFMADEDLQIGAVWTAPEARRLGLAATAIREAHRRHAALGRDFWYLVQDANPASIALAEACGYRLAGCGRRTRPLGVRGLGRFFMDRAAAP